ncbi:MAG: hypothetical protein WBX38_17050 [Candidatus Sulfotelmatobacter sp.]
MEERNRLSGINKMLTSAFAFICKPCPDAQVTLAWSDQLSAFSDEQIAVALDRVVRECEWLTFAAILERVPDGRPEPETAWATCPKSEEDSVVWTCEMSAAFGVARLHGGNEIAGRMAFLEAYKSEVAKARLELRPVRWSFSAGSDKADRVRALAEAVTAGRMEGKHAISLAGEQTNELRLALPETERKKLLLLEGDGPEVARLPENLRGFAALRDALPRSLTETKRRIEMTDEERAEHAKRVREQASAIARRAEQERQRGIVDKLVADPFVDPPIPPVSSRRPHRRRQRSVEA